MLANYLVVELRRSILRINCKKWLENQNTCVQQAADSVIAKCYNAELQAAKLAIAKRYNAELQAAKLVIARYTGKKKIIMRKQDFSFAKKQ